MRAKGAGGLRGVRGGAAGWTGKGGGAARAGPLLLPFPSEGLGGGPAGWHQGGGLGSHGRRAGVLAFADARQMKRTPATPVSGWRGARRASNTTDRRPVKGAAGWTKSGRESGELKELWKASSVAEP